MRNYKISVFYEKQPGEATSRPDAQFYVLTWDNLQTDFTALKVTLIDELDELDPDSNLAYDLHHGVIDAELRPDLSDSPDVATWLFEADECDLLHDEADGDEPSECHYETYMVTVEIDDEG